jgi:hypothetical protein
MTDFDNVKNILSSVQVHPGTQPDSCYVVLNVPIKPEKESISICINLVNNKLDQVVADISDAAGIPVYSGFVASGKEPVCPVYKHIK